jgi:hypothetical protein
MNIGERPTRVHGFFVIMGGFHAYLRDDSNLQSRSPDQPLYPLDQKKVIEKVKKGEIELPLEGEIQDKSKTDWLAKTLVLLQTGWFVIQCIARGVARLPLSELEVITLAYTIMNVGIYIAWWDKPRNVDRPIRVLLPPDSVEKERDDGSSMKGWVDALERMFVALIPGMDDDNLSTQSSVPTFYSGNPHQSRDFMQSAFVASAVGAVFGAIHFIAWSYSFPSHAEQLLWRISSVSMVGVPVCVLAISLLNTFESRYLRNGDAPLLIKICRRTIELVVAILWIVTGVLGPLVYVFARVVTFVLAFKTLSSLPAAAFQTIP